MTGGGRTGSNMGRSRAWPIIVLVSVATCHERACLSRQEELFAMAESTRGDVAEETIPVDEGSSKAFLTGAMKTSSSGPSTLHQAFSQCASITASRLFNMLTHAAILARLQFVHKMPMERPCSAFYRASTVCRFCDLWLRDCPTNWCMSMKQGVVEEGRLWPRQQRMS